MTGFIAKEKLTAYQRWEVAAFDEAEQAAQRAAKEAEERATRPVEPTPSPEPEQPPEEALVLPTAADIERIHTEAHEQGFSAGYEEGIAEAKGITTRLDALMNAVQQSIAALDQRVAEELLATALEVARQIVRQSLQAQPELLLPVIREAITTLHPHPGHPLLFVHPDDAELVRKHLGEQLAHNNWRIVEDAALTPGGCRVEHGASEVDATLETRWRRVIESIGLPPDRPAGKP